MIESSSASSRPIGSDGSKYGGGSTLFWGRNERRYRASSRQASSSSAVKCATPERDAWVAAPPSSSKVTSSPVTVFTTSGPVMNMYELSSTMKTKSVIAGEYTAPPAHGPMTRLIWGITPDDCTLRQKISAY